MTIPTIGGARGIFEIFIPGLFLLLNFIIIVSLLPFIDVATINQLSVIISNPALSTMFILVFAYLLGVILRLAQTDLVDQWSGKYLRRTDPNGRPKRHDNLFAYDSFPYVGWLAFVCYRNYPRQAVAFYYDVWAKKEARLTEEEYANLLKKFPHAKGILSPLLVRIKENVFLDIEKLSTDQMEQLGEALNDLKNYLEGKDKRFFNFCKVMVAAEDEKAANEVYSAEALTRYMAEMFYALALSFVLMLITLLVRLFALGQLHSILVLILIGYFFAIKGLLKRFRFIRIKEVETLFAATFKNRKMFEGYFNE